MPVPEVLTPPSSPIREPGRGWRNTTYPMRDVHLLPLFPTRLETGDTVLDCLDEPPWTFRTEIVEISGQQRAAGRDVGPLFEPSHVMFLCHLYERVRNCFCHLTSYLSC